MLIKQVDSGVWGRLNNISSLLSSYRLKPLFVGLWIRLTFIFIVRKNWVFK